MTLPDPVTRKRFLAPEWAFIFGIALWFWVRPIWRDLETLRQTARDLGDGNFEARSPQARSQLFAPLSDTMNSMAERVQQLLATHRELSSAISHELRTPIARMRFALEMLSDTDDRAERERLWAMMEGDLDELDHLIDTSLTYARFEREAPEPHFSSVHFAEWLCEEVDAVRLLGHDLKITVDTEKLPENLDIDVDRKAMPYALRNLLPELDPKVNLEFNPYFLDNALQRDLRLVEVPITFHKRIGESKGGNIDNLVALKLGLKMIKGIVFGWKAP